MPRNKATVPTTTPVPEPEVRREPGRNALITTTGEIITLSADVLPSADNKSNKRYPGHRLVRVAPTAGYDWVAVPVVPFA